MGTHGKKATLDRWKQRELKGINRAIEMLGKSIQIAPLKNGTIMCLLGNPKEGNISFAIEAKIVLDAAEAGIKFAEELKQKALQNDGGPASTQPVGGE